MTELTKDAVLEVISSRAKGRIKGSVRLDVEDMGVFFVDETGARESDQPSELTLSAKAKVFHDIATGALNPATAFMMRKLKVDGSPMRALKVGEILSTEG